MKKFTIITCLILSLFCLTSQHIPRGIDKKDHKEYMKAKEQIAKGDKVHETINILNQQVDSLSDIDYGGAMPKRVALRNEIYQRTISAGSLYTSGYDNMFALLTKSYQRYQKQNPDTYAQVKSAMRIGESQMKGANRLYKKSRRLGSESSAIDMALQALEYQRNSIKSLLKAGMLMSFDDDIITPDENQEIAPAPIAQPLLAENQEFDNAGHRKVTGEETLTVPIAGKDPLETYNYNDLNIYYTVQFKTLTREATIDNLKRWYAGKEFVELNRFDQYYRYSVGRFYSYSDANQFIFKEKMSGFVVAYMGEKRIAVVQARNILGH